MSLPAGWRVRPLGEVCSKPQYGWTSRAEKTGKVRYLRTTDISGAEVNWNSVPFCAQEPDSVAKYAIKDDDILVSRAGSVGVSYRVRAAPEQTVFASYLIRFRAYEDEAWPSYLSWFLKSDYYWKAISEQSAGIAIPNVNASKLAEIEVPLAPLLEQRRIAGKLDRIAARLDGTKARLDTIPTILKRFRRSVLAAACSGRLTEDWRKANSKIHPTGRAAEELNLIAVNKQKWASRNAGNHNEAARLLKRTKSVPTNDHQSQGLPDCWCWTTIRELCHLVVDCHNKTAPYAKHGIPLIRTTNVKDGRLLLDDTKFVDEKTYAYWSRRCPPEPGDIVFTREAPIGDAGIVPERKRVCLGQRTMLFRVWHPLTSNRYLLFAVLSPTFQAQYNDYAVGGGVIHLRVGDVEGLRLPLPPHAEQTEIVRRVESMMRHADAIESSYRKAKVFTDKLMPSVLSKAFRGELA